MVKLAANAKQKYLRGRCQQLVCFYNPEPNQLSHRKGQTRLRQTAADATLRYQSGRNAEQRFYNNSRKYLRSRKSFGRKQLNLRKRKDGFHDQPRLFQKNIGLENRILE